MKVTFECGKCNKKSNEMPKSSKDGRKLQCPFCKVWQTFNGKMEVIQ